MEDRIFEEEKKHIKNTISKLETAKVDLQRSLEVMGETNITKLKELREDPQTEPHDLLFFLETLHQQNATFNFKDKYKRLDEIEYLLKEPYFSRIDLKDHKEDHTESVYIGKFGYTEERPIITDWRAKIASVYYRYRYPQKNVYYDTPDGKEIRDLTLKRTYEIDNGILIKYYNNDIQLDEKEILIDKIEKRTGGVLEDIVETIQENQLDIIEADPRQVCIVQGCVGSGKTTVAIHKLSHIFFNHGDIIEPQRSILVTKNQIQAGYISTLFPKLGIFDVNYKSLRELIYNLVFREKLSISADLDADGEGDYGVERIRLVQEKIEEIHDRYKQQINKIFSEDDAETFAGFTYTKKSTVEENLNEVIEDMDEELGMQTENLKENPNSVRAYRYKQNIKILKKIISKLKRLRLKLGNQVMSEVITYLDIETNKPLSYMDSLMYLFVYSELIGFPNSLKYQYCVVDEGQDFTLLEYLVLGKLVFKGRFCILGDLNQSYSDSNISTWEDISLAIKDAKQANVFELDTNYRSTKPIIDYANKILQPFTQSYLPKSISRIGPEPEIKRYARNNDLLDELEKDLKEDHKNLNKSVAILSDNEEILTKTYNILQKLKIPEDKVVKLDSKERIVYIPRGFYISDFNECKGLEFSKVYVIGADPNEVKSFNEAKKSYVAVTRAMNELVVLTLPTN
jgi:DNA helicase II / ATP-dependent DNA helicase PcrA